MIISAKFITSLVKFDENLSSNFSEVAFLGRSNVGKSSLINSLCKQKNLAKSSATPGKTQLINFFEVICKRNEEKFNINFIDLPGFGYAKVSKNLKEIWNQNLDEFLKCFSSSIFKDFSSLKIKSLVKLLCSSNKTSLKYFNLKFCRFFLKIVG